MEKMSEESYWQQSINNLTRTLVIYVRCLVVCLIYIQSLKRKHATLLNVNVLIESLKFKGNFFKQRGQPL